jgi:hypothetical protein
MRYLVYLFAICWVAVVMLLSGQTAFAQKLPRYDSYAYAASPDSLIATLYKVISGPAGAARDWGQFRTLFHPSARLMATVADTATKGFALRVMSPDEYIAGPGKRITERGFFEQEIFRVTEGFGQILHAFSTYAARTKADDANPFVRGINSIQLFNDGKRWWILSVMWDSERPTNPIPERYVPPTARTK